MRTIPDKVPAVDASELSSSQLIDCHGRVTHTLVLLVDGSVRVRTDSMELTVVPATRQVLPPGARLPEAVLDHACALARL
jgi:hypothetical protein